MYGGDNLKKLFRSLSIFFTILSMLILSLSVYAAGNLPDEINCADYSIQFGKLYSAEFGTENLPVSTEISTGVKKYFVGEIKLLNTVPIKSVRMKMTERRYVLPGGEAVGIRLNTDGVIVTGTEDFLSEGVKTDPAGEAGILPGDVIISANGKIITNNAAFTEAISNSKGKTVIVTIRRSGNQIDVNLKPRLSDMTNSFKCGLWIRDCTSGIGTLTFRDPANSMIAALGHAIYERETKDIAPALNGEMTQAEITGIKKGKNGEAGELRGTLGSKKLGSLNLNCEMGIYGFTEPFNSTEALMPVAFISEIKPGKASIISSVIDGKKQYYDIEIEKIRYNDNESNKDMVIKITDKKLIEKTGGIIQGMSGSPIIQNGKLVGAVTHVFLNDPEKGYAIFAENMLKVSDAAA